MSATGKLALVAVLLTASHAAAEDDAPAIHQAEKDFYNAIGGRSFKLEATATPTTLTADDELSLTLAVSGVANPHRVRRPDLSELPSYKARFRTITPVGEPVVTADRVTFTYRLRPRDETVEEVPEVKFRYYSPASGVLPTAFFDAIPLQVRPAATVPPPAVPIIAPEQFFAIPPLKKRVAYPDLRHWVGLALGTVLLIAASVWFWRRRNPDGPRLARLRRNRAVRRVLDGLDRTTVAADPLGHTTSVLRRYFVERHGLFSNPTSPGEIETAFQAISFPPERIAQAVELLRQLDAARFDGCGDSGLSLVAQARELVLRWEGEI